MRQGSTQENAHYIYIELTVLDKPGKKGKKKGSDSDSDEDWGKNKKAPGSTAKKGGGGKGKGGGYTRAITLSPELAAIVGAEQMARHEVVKKVWSIIKERNLYVSILFVIIYIRFPRFIRHDIFLLRILLQRIMIILFSYRILRTSNLLFAMRN